MQIIALIENDLADQHADLVAEWGLSLYIKHQEKKILFDTGAKGALVRNAERLGVDLSQVDLVVLSHHHFDHGGGLPAFFAVNDHAKVYLRRPPDGEAYFRALLVVNRFVGLEEGLLDRYQDRFVYIDNFTEILPGAYIFTDIVRQHELPKGNRYLYLKQPTGHIHDSFSHELVLALRDEGGLVVFTGCSHSGAVNMIQTVAQRFPNDRIKGVVGGFHLVGIPTLNTMAGGKREMIDLARTMLQLPVDAYWTGHCTGQKAYAVLKTVLGARLAELHTGTTVTV
jgi:7,8-dihydropterin-6-yl-methyl-4-(beta-D-ribofuranosyl)aminobenzene 5'-phosphate synthase